MRKSLKNQQERQILGAFASILGVSPPGIESGPGEHVDLILEAEGRVFAVEFKASSGAGPISHAAQQALREAGTGRRRILPVVATTHMGDSGRRACDRAGVSWFDLSGNARIIDGPLRIMIEGRPNLNRSRGRPSSAFAPKSSRIARFLLSHLEGRFSQREIAHATEMSEGFVSRIVSRLAEENYILRNEDGAIGVRSAPDLLDAWNEDYDFSRHRIVRGHVAARSGEALSRFLSGVFEAHGIEHAATGLSAAWQYSQFASFRIASFYLQEEISESFKGLLGFRDDPRGANLWLIQPNDEGVFQGAREQLGIRCAHPLQVYLDLQDHPERASEAAEELRSKLIGW